MQVTYPDEYVWNIKQGSQLWFIMSAQSKDAIFMHFQSRVSPVKARQKIPFTVSLHVKDIQNKTETHWKAWLCSHFNLIHMSHTVDGFDCSVGDGSLRLWDKSLFVGLEIILHNWCILRLKVAHSLFESKLNCLLRSLCMHLCGQHFHRSTFSVAHPGRVSAVASSSSGGTPSCFHPCPVCLWASSLLTSDTSLFLIYEISLCIIFISIRFSIFALYFSHGGTS